YFPRATFKPLFRALGAPCDSRKLIICRECSVSRDERAIGTPPSLMTIISSDTAFCVSAEVTLFFSNSNRSFVGMITETSGFIFQCLPPFLRVRMESTPVAHGVAPLQEHPELRFQRLLELNLLGQEHIEDTQD